MGRLPGYAIRRRSLPPRMNFLRTTATDRASIERKLAEVEASLGALDANLRDLITALTIGSRHLQVFGAVLIMVGTGLIIASPLLP
jgi:hypothetical protein